MTALLQGGYYHLKFPEPLESEFRRVYKDVAKKSFGLNSTYVVLIFLILGGILFFSLPKEEWGMFLEAYLFVGAILGVVIWLSRHDNYDPYMEWYIGVAAVLGLATLMIAGMTAVTPKMQLAAMAAVIFGFIIVYSFAKQRCMLVFIWSMMAGAIHILVAMSATHMSIDWLSFQAYFVGSNLIGLALAYMLEHRERTVFLQKRLLDLDRAAIEALNQELERLSYEDSLTHLPNRRVFEQTLEREWNRCQRNGLRLSCVFIDVDCFKQYNDHYGHQRGDWCLKQIADVLAAEAGRATDLAARYGGEEFIILYTEITQEQVMANLQRIRERLHGLNLKHKYSLVADRVTISMGVASVVPSQELAPKELLYRADQALYEAKREGRDQCRVAA